jgi:hypothetical protein
LKQSPENPNAAFLHSLRTARDGEEKILAVFNFAVQQIQTTADLNGISFKHAHKMGSSEELETVQGRLQIPLEGRSWRLFQITD